MVHPCKASNPGTTLHACDTVDSATTLCGLPVKAEGVNVLAGYTKVCRRCFPKGQGEDDGDPIEGRTDTVRQ